MAATLDSEARQTLVDERAGLQHDRIAPARAVLRGAMEGEDIGV